MNQIFRQLGDPSAGCLTPSIINEGLDDNVYCRKIVRIFLMNLQRNLYGFELLTHTPKMIHQLSQYPQVVGFERYRPLEILGGPFKMVFESPQGFLHRLRFEYMANLYVPEEQFAARVPPAELVESPMPTPVKVLVPPSPKIVPPLKQSSAMPSSTAVLGKSARGCAQHGARYLDNGTTLQASRQRRVCSITSNWTGWCVSWPKAPLSHSGAEAWLPDWTAGHPTIAL